MYYNNDRIDVRVPFYFSVIVAGKKDRCLFIDV